MYALKSKLHLVFTFTILFVGLSILAFMDTASADETGTRANSITHTPTDVSISATTSDGASSATEYVSPEFTAQFTFNGVGLIWTGSETADVSFALQVDDGDWNNLAMMGDDAKDAGEFFTSVPLFVTGERVRYKITGDTGAVQNVRLTYFDSTVRPYRSITSTLRQVLGRTLASSDLTVISRSDWGADESYRTWAPDYQTPTKIVIHHTAGGDGGEDAAATVRGIYYWHAVVLGWGDIGYNYLIDPAGNVYEGRSGGDGAIGAHAYNSYTDTNYNEGSIGVALLGCYEAEAGACDTVHTVTEPMQQSLVELVANKSAQFSFDPASSSVWFGAELPNVLTHRDIDYTYCPGSIVYAALSDTRIAANEQYLSLRGNKTKNYQALFSGSDLANSYYLTETPTVTTEYSNIGNHRWKQSAVVMQMRIAETGKRQRVNLDSNVIATSSAVLTAALTILPERIGTYTLTTRLYQHGHAIPGSKHSATLEITNPYTAKVISADLPVAIVSGWEPTLQLVVRNTGEITIPAGTNIEVNGEPVYTIGQDWAVGEKRDFAIPLRQGLTWPVGVQRVVITFKVNDITVDQSRTVRTVRVD
ncbi:MAG: N-acetylmuramoyl-L-alanine amidase [Candidatus Kerfeldbacteria bacterium]|nr:N-acetylmuramoyl-L-alanine amidase [Candidatus Kerfeldbacteria bacterium]